jgi:uncharacterized membrane protein (UPF0136 family)
MAITIINLILCIIILCLGIWGYSKKKSDVALYIGIAFGLFGISHLITLLGLATALDALLIIIRLIAYLLVAFTLYRIVTKK